MGRFLFGVCEWSLRARGRRLCEMAARQGLDCLQLGVGEEVFRGENLENSRVVEEYREACGACNIRIHSLSPQFVDQYSFTMPQSAEEERVATALVEKTIDLAAAFGCGSFLLPVLCKNDIQDGPSFHRAVEYIRRFANQAAEHGIETHLELNQSVRQVRNLLDAVDHPMVKLFFDSQNLYALDGTAMAGYFTELADVIGGVHLKDGVGSMLSGSLLGAGTSGFEKTARAILESDYSGCLIIESVYAKPTVCGLGTEEELLARDAATLYKIFLGGRQNAQHFFSCLPTTCP